VGKAGAGPRLVALADRLEGLGEWTLATVEAATRGLATDLGVKAGEVIAPARVAVTGRKAAPGIFEVLWLVGREGAVARLRAAAARWQAESPLAAGA
jgi:glutamyl-tRNA synthetase